MSKVLTPSELRANIYKALDYVIRTGEPIEINRNGKKLKIIFPQGATKLSKLKKRKISDKKLDSLEDIDWSDLWKAKID